MKMNYDNTEVEKRLYSAIEKEKGKVFNNHNNRVNMIMDKVDELSKQTLYEVERFTPRFVFVYGLSMVITICLGCFIGNITDIYTSVFETSSIAGINLLDISFGGFITPI